MGESSSEPLRSPDGNFDLSPEDISSVRPIIISVIGPTNEGKTSVLRTLTGDPDFGEVNALTGTTVRAEYQKVWFRGRVEILRLIDTPGFQMSGKILDRLTSRAGEKNFTLDDLLAAIPDEDADFRHDRRAWTEVAQSDMLLFIANVAEPPDQSLMRDTLALLTHVARPVIVVFNNLGTQRDETSAKGDFTERWHKRLGEIGLHLTQNYDAHRRRFDDEFQLFEKIAVHVRAQPALKILRAEMGRRRDAESLRLEQSRRGIAEFLLDVAALELVRENVDSERKNGVAADLSQRLETAVAERELAAFREILAVWGFPPGIVDRPAPSVEGYVDEQDHRFGRALGEHSFRGVRGGAVAGATGGLTLDVMFGGMSFGAAALIGGVVGAAVGLLGGGWYNAAYDAKDKIISVRPKRDILSPLLSRAVELVEQAQHRGCAMENTIALLLAQSPKKIAAPKFLALLDRFAAETKISRLTAAHDVDRPVDEARRHEAISELSDALAALLSHPRPL